MANTFTVSQISNLKEAFLKFDVNDDGTITTAELGSLMAELGQHVSNTSLRNMIAEFDIDNNGTIEFSEFLQMLSREMKDTDFEDKMNKEFCSYDKNGDGFITAAQLRVAMAKNCDTITDGEFDQWLHDKQIRDNDKIQYKRFFERKRSIQLMPSDQLSMYKEAFSQIDLDKDGTITIDELKALMKKLNIHNTEKGFQNMIAELDADGNGIIDYLEFLSMMANNGDDDTDFERRINREFRKYDTNNDGHITTAELRTVMGKVCDTMTVGEFDEYLQDAELEDDDRINYKSYFSRRFSNDSIQTLDQLQVEHLTSVEE